MNAHRKVQMLDAIPNSMLSWSYTIYQREEAIAILDAALFRERAEFTIDGCAYSLNRESIFRGTFVLQSNGQVLASAKKSSVFNRRFEVDIDGKILELRPTSIWGRRFELLENNRSVGHIGPVGWFTRRATVELPDALPRAVQIFIFWLVLILWRRAASSAASGGG
jgi:uncharacterized protein YxjI